jgi:uncharacterized protein YukE
MPTTTNLSFDDLIAQYDPELSDLQDAYDELTETIDDAVDDMEPEDDDAGQQIMALRQLAQGYQQTMQTIEARQTFLEGIREDWDGDTFEVQLLTGSDTMQIEKELRMVAQDDWVDQQFLQRKRQRLVTDAAVIDAPAAVPQEDGDPQPSECPNQVVEALAEAVNAYQTGGSPDFRPQGYGDPRESVADAMSALPTSAASQSSPSPPTDDSAPSPGDS